MDWERDWTVLSRIKKLNLQFQIKQKENKKKRNPVKAVKSW